MFDTGLMIQVGTRIVIGHVMAWHFHGYFNRRIGCCIHLHLRAHGPGCVCRNRQPQHEKEADEFFHDLKIAHFITV